MSQVKHCVAPTIYLVLVSLARAEAPAERLIGDSVHHEAAAAEVSLSNRSLAPLWRSGLGEHPLLPILYRAKESLARIAEIKDYTAIMVAHERIGNSMGPRQYIAIKVRHRPFSVYMKFLRPSAVKGQEIIYEEGANGGKMWAHGAGIKDTLIGTILLDPTGVLAMKGEHYPVTQIGILNLIKRLIVVAEKDVKYGECEVKYVEKAKVNNRTCTCIQVVHPLPRKNFLFYIVRIFIDDTLNLPVRYEAYDWPKSEGSPPEEIEEYTYLDVKPNVGLATADFDIHNPSYHFRTVAERSASTIKP